MLNVMSYYGSNYNIDDGCKNGFNKSPQSTSPWNALTRKQSMKWTPQTIQNDKSTFIIWRRRIVDFILRHFSLRWTQAPRCSEWGKQK